MLLAFKWRSFLYSVVLCNWWVTLGWKDPNSLWESWINSLVVHQVIWIVLRLHLKRDSDRLWEGNVCIVLTKEKTNLKKNKTEKNNISLTQLWRMLLPKGFIIPTLKLIYNSNLEMDYRLTFCNIQIVPFCIDCRHRKGKHFILGMFCLVPSILWVQGVNWCSYVHQRDLCARLYFSMLS